MVKLWFLQITERRIGMSADKYKFNINTTDLEKIESCYDEKSLIKASELIKNYCKKNAM